MNITSSKLHILGFLIAILLVSLVYQIFFDKSQDIKIAIPEVHTDPLVISAPNFNFSMKPADVLVSPQAVREYRDLGSEIREIIVFKTSEHPRELKYLLDLQGLDWQKDPTGNLIFYPKGKTDKLHKLFTIQKPIADSNMEIKDNILTIKLSEEWLNEQKYPLVLNSEIEINILNVHSHPQRGENWTVDFTAQGKADLKIIPNNQATIDDDEFVSLSCEGKRLKPQMLEGDVIYYPDWSCKGVGKVVHYTLKAGKHSLRFEFGDVSTDSGQVAFAYNSPWWDSNWSYRRKITFDTTTSATTTNLTNFPVAVQLNSTSSRIDYTKTQNAGEDIRFVDSDDTTELQYEIEKWDETGTSTLWVKVPTITANTSTDYIWMYYGNAGALDNSTTTGVWDSNYVAVYHLSEDPSGTAPQINDSTINGNNATSVGSMTSGDQVDGQLDGSIDFDGTDDTLEADDDPSLNFGTGDFTIEAWVYNRSLVEEGTISKGRGGTGGKRYLVRTGNQVKVEIDDDVTKTTFLSNVYTINQWNHLVLVADRSNKGTIYVNGAVSGTPADITGSSGSLDDTSLPLRIGRETTNDSWVNAIIDEVRLSNVVRSADWISFSYCSMADDGVCVTYGTEEAGAAPSAAATVKLKSGTIKLKSGTVKIK